MGIPQRAVASDEHAPPEITDTPNLALLEDEYSDEMLKRLEREHFKVLTPSDRRHCLDLLSHGCRIFLLDVNLGPGRTTEGLQTLQDIKSKVPEAYCAVITSNPMNYDLAWRFRADDVFGKESAEIEVLFRKLSGIFINRHYPRGQWAASSEAKAPLHEMAVKTRTGFQHLTVVLQSRFAEVDAAVASGDIGNAALSLVILEPTLRALCKFAEEFGDGYGIAIHALENAVLQHPGREFTFEQWSVWHRVFEKLSAEPRIPSPAGAALADELDEAGFDTEPFDWSQLDKDRAGTNASPDDPPEAGSST